MQEEGVENPDGSFYCRNKSQKNLPHPECQVRGRCGQQQVDGIAQLLFEEIAALQGSAQALFFRDVG